MTDDPEMIDMTGDDMDLSALLEGFAVNGEELLAGQSQERTLRRRATALMYALSFHTDGANDPMTGDAAQVARTAVTFDKFLESGQAPGEVTLKVV
jgi:hypothetical protein